ncbi:unnamed protein product [Wickerhamomyces anomalus]
MGLFDSVKNQVGEENFSKIQGALGGSGDKKSGEQTDYVKKAEGYIGEDRLKQIKDKVGEDNYKKGEDAIRKQFGGSSSEAERKTEESK